jgi:hypothetical protein
VTDVLRATDPLTVPDSAPTESTHQRAPIACAILGFALFAFLVLIKSPAMLEPDDFAYRASIVALSHGEILLTNAQYHALSTQLAASGGQGILQWHHMASGKWISEKNPGYPFFAVLFYLIHALRLAPLFYGALACVGLFCGARAWLGRWAGTYAVWLFGLSGAALTFAWRATMASFTDASLIAFGFGALLWVALTPDARPRRRLMVGLVAYLALEGAVFIRYTDAIELIVAVGATLALGRRVALSWRAIVTWLSSVALFVVGVLAFDAWAYGKATSTGYSPGEITFSLSSLWPNLKGMPGQLTTSMPMWLLAAASLTWIVVRRVRARNRVDSMSVSARRDAAVAAVLALGWLGLWLVYLNYSWTVSMVSGHGGPGGGVTVHVIRFYIPALGLIALLGTWLLVRLRAWMSWTTVAALSLAGVLSFNSMASGALVGGPPGARFGYRHGSPTLGGRPPIGAPGGGSRGVPKGVPPRARS